MAVNISRSKSPANEAAALRVPAPKVYVYFDAIMRHGSIRSAAQSLRIASSALNRRLIDLERDMGTVLFERLPAGVRLTASGEIFAAHVQRTLEDARLVGARLDEIDGREGGHVAIGSAESAALDILPAFMADFQKTAPATRFTLAVGAPNESLASLLDDRVDMILTHQAPAQHDVAIVAAAPMPFCAMMRADHPLAARTKLSIQDCLSFPIVLAEENLAARALVDSALSASALKLQPVLVTNMFEVMKTYVRLTQAISFQFHLAPYGDAGLDGLVAVRLADKQLAASKLTLARRRGRVLSAGALAVCARLRALLQGQAG